MANAASAVLYEPADPTSTGDHSLGPSAARNMCPMRTDPTRSGSRSINARLCTRNASRNRAPSWVGSGRSNRASAPSNCTATGRLPFAQIAPPACTHPQPCSASSRHPVDRYSVVCSNSSEVSRIASHTFDRPAGRES